MQPSRVRPVLGAVLVPLALLTACSHPSTPAPATPATSAATSPASGGAPAASAAPTGATGSGTPGALPATSSPRVTEAAPSSSGGASTEPRRPVVTAPPRPLDKPGKTADLQVSLVSVKTQSIKATVPGDSSGPGVLVRLELRNPTAKTLDTSLVQVNVANAGQNPGSAVDGPPTQRVVRSLPAGRSAQGTYAFLLDGASAGQVTVLVSVRSGQPVLQFRGRAG